MLTFLIQPVQAINNPLFQNADAKVLQPDQFFNQVLGAVLGVFFFVGLLYFTWYFVMGGLNMIHSEGDAKKYEQARDMLTNAFVGLIVVFSLFAILKFVGIFFGISSLTGPGPLTLPWPKI